VADDLVDAEFEPGEQGIRGRSNFVAPSAVDAASQQ